MTNNTNSKKIVFISDTHSYTPEIPEGDILIHSGDYSSGLGTKKHLRDFLEWLESMEDKFDRIIFIAGNHDFYCETNPDGAKRLVDQTNIIMLNDSGIEIDGIKIWGSPISPEFCSWAFNRKRGDQIQKHWDLIPNDTDILITHGPPYGILDECRYHNGNPHQGCENLKNEVVNRIKPKIHCFGHIHEAYGEKHINNIHFINASTCNLSYYPINKPIVVEYKYD